MYITKAKYEEIKKKYCRLLILEGDDAEALCFVQDLMEAEADAIKEHEPHAYASINRLQEAAYEVFGVCQDIECDEFSDGTN